MMDLWGNTKKNRKQFRLVAGMGLFFICAIICTLVFLVNLGTEKPKKTTPITISQEQKDFDALFLRVKQLEELSKQYDETDYQLRTMIYIRSGAYNDSQWSTIAGAVDADFELYVETNQGTNNLTGLKTVETFKVPSTKEVVDFRHMFAVMNVAYSNVQNTTDLSGWAGDLVQLMDEFKSSIKTGDELLTVIRAAFNGNSTFGSADVCADFDAVNIIKNLKSTNGATIYSSINSYYKNLTNQRRIQTFKQTTFATGYTNAEELEAVVLNRLKFNMYISLLASTYGLDFTTHAHIVDACIQVFVEYLYSV